MSDLYAQFDAMFQEGKGKGHFTKALHNKDELEGLSDTYMTTIGQFTDLQREQFGEASVKLQDLVPKMQLDIYNTLIAVVIGTKDYTFWPTEENLQNLRGLTEQPLQSYINIIRKKHLLAEKYREDVEEVQLSLMKMQNGILKFQTDIDTLEMLNATLGQFDPSDTDTKDKNMKIIEQLSSFNLSELTKDLKQCLITLSQALSQGTSGDVFQCIKSDLEARWTFLKALTYLTYVAESIYDKRHAKAREVLLFHYSALETVEKDLLMDYYNTADLQRVSNQQLKGPPLPGPMTNDYLIRLLGAIKKHIEAVQKLEVTLGGKDAADGGALYSDEDTSKEELVRSGSKAVKEIITGIPREPGKIRSALNKLKASLSKIPRPRVSFE
jgi:hypothetical protein